MDYVIAVVASVWLVPFLVLEHRAGGRAGFAWRLVGVIPFIVLSVLVWTGRFSTDAFVIAVFAIVIATSAEPVIRWRQGRAVSRNHG